MGNNKKPIHMVKAQPKTKVTSISFDEEKPPFYKKWWVWVIIILVTLVIPVTVFVVINSSLIFGGPGTPISPLAP